MPPRYVYWTIIVDGQPTAFRSGSLEDIMPTFNRVKEKQPSAELKWFQHGQLWPSRHDAQDFMRARGERGRAKDPRQSKGDDTNVASGFSRTEKPSFAKASEGKPERAWNAKPEWKTRSTFSPRKEVGSGFSRSEKPSYAKATEDKPEGRPEWKPKGTFKPKEAGHASGWGEKPGWKPASAKASAWRAPKGTARDQARSSFRPKSYSPKPDDGMTRSSRVQSRNDKLEWTPAAKAPAGQAPERRPGGPNAGFKKSDPDAPKRKWVPKAEYKKSLGIEAKRDDKWRPGGEHKDPRQKYKDAKKAKWTRVKATIRARSSKPRKPKDE